MLAVPGTEAVRGGEISAAQAELDYGAEAIAEARRLIAADPASDSTLARDRDASALVRARFL